jgi:hypothetical protein
MRCRRLLILTSVVLVAAFSLLAAGCGGSNEPGVASVATPSSSGSPSPGASASRTHTLLLAGQCLRQHGIPNLPDPTIASSGPATGQAILDKQAFLAVPSSVVNQAMAACRTALEQAGIRSGPNAGANPQEIQNLLAFARCMRNHGISNFPDPNSQGDFNFAGTGISQASLSQALLATARTCLPTAHGAVHMPVRH